LKDKSYEQYSTWKNWGNKYFGSFSREEGAYFDAELRSCGFGSNKLRILELGFGNGCFAGWAKNRGHDYVGLEIIPELVERGRSQDFNVAETPSDLSKMFQPDSFDLIVAFDVFEHIPTDRLIVVLSQILKILGLGGIVLARFPSGDSPFSRAYQHGDITHRSCLGSSAVRQIAAASGAIVVSLRAPQLPLRGLPLRSKARRMGVILASTPLYWFISRVIIGNPTVVLSPNLIAVLKRSV
jgi:SAM-dependent methyltransferase